MMSIRPAQEAEKMSAYLRAQFSFLGVRASVRRKMTKEFLNPYKKAPLNWTFIEEAWKSLYREMHYGAIDYLAMNKRGIAV